MSRDDEETKPKRRRISTKMTFDHDADPVEQDEPFDSKGEEKKTLPPPISRRISKAKKAERTRKLKLERQAAKRARRETREKERRRLGDAAPPKEIPRTLENTREYDETTVKDEDDEVALDEAHDEMASYFNRDRPPKVMVSMSPFAKNKTYRLAHELQKCIPGAEVFARKNVPLKKVVKLAGERGYTDLIVVHEDNKMPNGLILCHLPEGPTAYFKINSFKFTKDLKKFGEATAHPPELIMNNFNTRLGHTIARQLACLFPFQPDFKGRRVVTFHNQRDYIFMRHHRYEFKREGEKVALLELGPRITLRLKWLQRAPFDTRCGEFEWVLKRHEMETSRRRFFL